MLRRATEQCYNVCMEKRRIGGTVERNALNRRRLAAAAPAEPTREVRTTVFALVTEFELVYVRDHVGTQYALTPETKGIDVSSLHKGQVLVCVVDSRVSRVLSARELT